MRRSNATAIWNDLDKKVVLLSGPRQVGKTTLAKQLRGSYEYLNFDAPEHRLILAEQSWDRDKELLILDELHKQTDWKAWVKGLYDTEGCRPRLLVTGSARLNTHRHVGDSLAGRFFHHRLHPLDVKELKGKFSADEAFNRLMTVGGFPEPLLDGGEKFYRRWRRAHLDVILRQDVMDSESVSDIKAMELLVELIRRRVGSPLSYANLARDVDKDPKTVKRWIEILEDHYVLFRVTPYHKNIARSLLKEPKLYLFDNGQVQADDPGAKFENLVALALRKELDRLEDMEGARTGLHYLRTKDGREIDFLVTLDDTPVVMIEAKWAADKVHPHFRHFAEFLPDARALQIVRELKREKTYPSGLALRRAVPWLRKMKLA